MNPYSILHRTHSVLNGRAAHFISRCLACLYGCSTTMAPHRRIYSALMDMVTGLSQGSTAMPMLFIRCSKLGSAESIKRLVSNSWLGC